MGQISQTTQQVNDMMDRMLNPFQEDMSDGTHTVSSPQSITAGVPVRFEMDGSVRHVLTRPSYMTDSWDTVNDKIAVPSEYDSYEYVANAGWTFDPDSASAGIATLRIWIDDAVPKEIGTYQTSYKGSSPNKARIVASWYWGAESGYDAKNDGIYFTLEFESDGSLYDRSLRIYNTQ